MSTRYERNWRITVACMMVGLTIGAYFTSPADAANPRQSVIAYTVADACVDEGQATTIEFHVRNIGSKDITVVIRPWGLESPVDFESQKGGPTVDVDIKSSGLRNTAQDPSWRWVVRLKPGASESRTLFVNAVSQMWYPEWGAPPPVTLRFYLGAAVNVRHSQEAHFPGVNIPYRPFCS